MNSRWGRDNMTTANNFATILSNWEYVLPPSRPSVSELERIRALLVREDKDIPVAILGSTIEFRNLLHEMNFRNIYIFEKNPDFYKWTNSWIIDGLENENIVCGDWLDTIKGYKDAFAIVLSDLTMGNIDYIYRKDFYTAIYNSIHPSGLFVDKVLTHCIPHIPIDFLEKQYQQMPLNLESVNRFSCEVLFCSDLLNNNIVDTTTFYDILRKRFKSPLLLKYVEKCHLITPEGCVWYYGKAWDELREDYAQSYKKSYFFEDHPGSPYYGRLKQFIHIK